VKPVRYHRLASREVLAEIRYYNRKQPGLGFDFLQRVQEAELRFRTNPLLYPVFGNTPFRECRVNRFPHAVYFVEVSNEFLVIAVASLRKRPGYWLRRPIIRP